MSVEDFRINAFVRQVLSRCWVDLKKLHYGAVGRTVYFHGCFEKTRAPRSTEEESWQRHREEEVAENLALLQRVEKEVRREPLVIDVVFRLDNFRRHQGKWISSGA